MLLDLLERPIGAAHKDPDAAVGVLVDGGVAGQVAAQSP